MKAKEALNKLGVTRITLSTLVKNGKIQAIKGDNGRYEYDDESINQYVSKKLKNSCSSNEIEKIKMSLDRIIDVNIQEKIDGMSDRELMCEIYRMLYKLTL